MKNWWKKLNTPKYTSIGLIGWTAYMIWVYEKVVWIKIPALIISTIILGWILIRDDKNKRLPQENN